MRVDELPAEPGERLHYQYDYGDNWWLTLEVEDVADRTVPTGRARLLEGAGAGPPEDCGGIHGYRMIVAASDPGHPDHARALAEVAGWWGREVAPDEVGLVPFDPDAVGERLQASDLAGRPPGTVQGAGRGFGQGSESLVCGGQDIDSGPGWATYRQPRW